MTSELWNTSAMKHLDESERLKMERKLLKPQVERRRRERMNRSLESLRILLLQSPEAGFRRRVEKAEILENTVLFLQTSLAQTRKNQAPEEAPDVKEFMDGFSACLHKAAHFLQVEGEARGLQKSLPSNLYQHLSGPRVPASGTMPTWARISPRTNNPKKSQNLVACKQGLKSEKRNVHLTHPYRVSVQHTHSNGLVQGHRNTHHPTTQPTSGQQASVWRPWP